MQKDKTSKRKSFLAEKKGSLRIDLTAELHFTMGPKNSEINGFYEFFQRNPDLKPIQVHILTNQKTGFKELLYY